MKKAAKPRPNVAEEPAAHQLVIGGVSITDPIADRKDKAGITVEETYDGPLDTDSLPAEMVRLKNAYKQFDALAKLAGFHAFSHVSFIMYHRTSESVGYNRWHRMFVMYNEDKSLGIYQVTPITSGENSLFLLLDGKKQKLKSDRAFGAHDAYFSIRFITHFNEILEKIPRKPILPLPKPSAANLYFVDADLTIPGAYQTNRVTKDTRKPVCWAYQRNISPNDLVLGVPQLTTTISLDHVPHLLKKILPESQADRCTKLHKEVFKNIDVFMKNSETIPNLPINTPENVFNTLFYLIYYHVTEETYASDPIKTTYFKGYFNQKLRTNPIYLVTGASDEELTNIENPIDLRKSIMYTYFMEYKPVSRDYSLYSNEFIKFTGFIKRCYENIEKVVYIQGHPIIPNRYYLTPSKKWIELIQKEGGTVTPQWYVNPSPLKGDRDNINPIGGVSLEKGKWDYDDWSVNVWDWPPYLNRGDGSIPFPITTEMRDFGTIGKKLLGIDASTNGVDYHDLEKMVVSVFQTYFQSINGLRRIDWGVEFEMGLILSDAERTIAQKFNNRQPIRTIGKTQVTSELYVPTEKHKPFYIKSGIYNDQGIPYVKYKLFDCDAKGVDAPFSILNKNDGSISKHDDLPRCTYNPEFILGVFSTTLPEVKEEKIELTEFRENLAQIEPIIQSILHTEKVSVPALIPCSDVYGGRKRRSRRKQRRSRIKRKSRSR